ncbi:SGNH/GDSL hydrolase family protein [Streptococcus merionis]|uniref:GDSL family lipase/acylhydrolase n=1 Tax=Streptococcus merionis TaxID=400065 RepID=A0A239STP6_9STRE|nr:SGNH/GDSL hydrolase family protein [Streptococcus merionis]SNU88790.1 GDSL family lipase/acylhydrolase [Streptococcus merionis]
MNKRGLLTSLIGLGLSFGLAFFLFQALIPEAKPLLLRTTEEKKPSRQPFHYVALGDSLTEGVGDSTGQGGFVPLVASNLSLQYGYDVQVENYGVAGNTSNQILKRLTEDIHLQEHLAQADLLTLTVGGNDVMRVIRQNLANLTVDTFEKPAQEYSQRLRDIITQARAENPDLPIYVLGIYNPFYLNFPEITEMQTVIDNWNSVTEQTLASIDRAYFVPINDRLYRGIDGQEGITENANGQSVVVNDALFEGDHFHPNNIGYQIMQAAIMEKLDETRQIWQQD